jgi:hypothetical protein
MKRQDTLGIRKHLILASLAVAAGAGLLNRLPLRRPLRRERQA